LGSGRPVRFFVRKKGGPQMGPQKRFEGRRLAIRLTKAQEAKVAYLAERTDRTASDVLRQLIERAEVAPEPDIRLAGKGEHGE